MKKLILFIDCQYDFLDNGKLGVDGSTNIMDELCKYVDKNGMEYEAAIATVDWHPIDHCSFKENGGMWPEHCLMHSSGAAIYEPLLKAIHKGTKSFTILTKGVNPDHEEYSIFKNEKSCKKLLDMVDKLEIEEIDVVGIALSYCVKDSVSDGKRMLPHVKFKVLTKYTPDIGDSTETIKWLENNNFEII